MRIWKSVSLVAVVAAFGWTAAVAAADEDAKGHKHVAVTLDKVPQAAKDGLMKAAKGAKLENVRSETDEGKTYYEADVTQGGKHAEVRVDAAGKASPEDDDDGDEGR